MARAGGAGGARAAEPRARRQETAAPPEESVPGPVRRAAQGRPPGLGKGRTSAGPASLPSGQGRRARPRCGEGTESASPDTGRLDARPYAGKEPTRVSGPYPPLLWGRGLTRLGAAPLSGGTASLTGGGPPFPVGDQRAARQASAASNSSAGTSFTNSAPASCRSSFQRRLSSGEREDFRVLGVTVPHSSICRASSASRN